MQVCFNQITIRRRAPESIDVLASDLATLRAGGWTRMEVWLRHLDDLFDEASLPAARRLLDDAGIAAAGGCAQAGLFFSTGDDLRAARDGFERRLAQCRALGAPHLVVTPNTAGKRVPENPSAADLDVAAENLRWAGDLAARYGVRLGIEFLKFADFVTTLPTSLMLAERTSHSHVGVLVDTFHLYAGLSKVEDLHLLRSNPSLLFFVHVNDIPASIPRELLRDPDRVLPGEGDVPLTAIFDGFRAHCFTGPVSLELFNDSFSARWAASPEATSRAAYEATARLVQA